MTEEQLQKLKEKQWKYWRDRAERMFKAGEKDALQVAKSLKSNYSQCIREIDDRINVFYGKYANREGITIEEAKRLLNRDELKNFKSYINECMKLGKQINLPKSEMNRLKLLKAKAKISRLDELQSSIRFELDKISAMTRDEVHDLLSRQYEDGYYETVFNAQQFTGFASSFSSLNAKEIEKAVGQKWLSANYESRIWTNQNNLMTILERDIPRGLTLGYNSQKLAKEVINPRIDKTYYNQVVRLIRTEYSHIKNEAVFDGYVAAGIDRYQILATLDSRTSEICQSMDSLIIPLKDKEEGVNYPPFHPNCRTTTVAYFEPDEFDEPVAQQVPLDITYKEWKDNLSQQYNGKVHYKGGK